MTNERRTEYNKAHYAIQKKRNDELKAFKEAYPERYAELVAKVQAEASAPRPVVQREVIDISFTGKRPLTTEEIDAIVYDPHERHVFIVSVDKWNGEHPNLFNIPWPTDNVDQAVQEALRQWHGDYTVTSYRICN